MKTCLSKIRTSKGFTLIELLVVIGILGVLAAALVATIDPFEQIKKANDSNTKNVAVELNNAILRYYATHNAFPWNAVAAGGANCNGGQAPAGTVALNNSTLATCIEALTDENELKKAFEQSNDLKLIYLTYDSTNNDIIACYQPQSKSGQTVATLNANGTAGAGAGTKTCAFDANGQPADLSGGCFWCTGEASTP